MTDRYGTDPGIAEAVRYLMEQQELVRAPKREPLPAPILGGGGTPTVTVAAYNATDYSKRKADMICPGEDDDGTFRRALAILASKLNDAPVAIGGRIKLTEGDFYLGQTIILRSAVAFEGLGVGMTVLHSAHSPALSGATNATMFEIDHSAGTSALSDPRSFSRLEMNGHKAIQTAGSPNGVYVDPNGSAVLSFDHVKIHGFRGWGLYFDRCADTVEIDFCQISDNTMSGIEIVREGWFKVTESSIFGNTQHGIEGPGARIALLGCSIFENIWEGFSSGGVLQQAGQVIVGNHFYQNRTGIVLDGYESIIADNFFEANVNGISVAGNRPMTIVGNSVYANSGFGISLAGGAGNLGGTVTGNVVSGNGTHGIIVAGSDWLVEGNRVHNNGYTASNTYDGIVVLSGATNNAVLSNMIRQSAAAAVQRYGLNIQAGAVGTYAAGNDARGGGFGTAAFVDAGTASLLTWAGGFGDNRP